MVVSTNGEKAYFSSDHLDTTGIVNIYHFKLYPKAQPVRSTYLAGVVRDAETLKPLMARVHIYSLSDKELLGDYHTDDQGKFLAILPEDNEFAINVTASNYLFYSGTLKLDSVSSATKPIHRYIDLEKVSPGKVLTLNNIYFPTDKFDLDPKSEFELNQLLQFMRSNKSVHILIKGTY